MDTRNQESWASLQESESGSEELLNNAESFAAYLALELDDSGGNQVRYSRENVGELSYGISSSFSAQVHDYYISTGPGFKPELVYIYRIAGLFRGGKLSWFGRQQMFHG